MLITIYTLFGITIFMLILSFLLFVIGSKRPSEKLEHASAIIFLIGIVIGFVFAIITAIGYITKVTGL